MIDQRCYCLKIEVGCSKERAHQLKRLVLVKNNTQGFQQSFNTMQPHVLMRFLSPENPMTLISHIAMQTMTLLTCLNQHRTQQKPNANA